MKVVTVTLNPAIDLTVRADHLQLGLVNAGHDLQMHAAGKGVNVASILADAGLEVTATGLLGDENPEAFERLFARKGIQDQFVRIPGGTRLGLKIVDEARNQTTDINLPGIQVSEKDLLKVQRRILDLAEGHDLFVLAGSLPPGIPEDFYFHLTLELKKLGKKVVLDTSNSPLMEGIKALPDGVKPNLHELSVLTGKDLHNAQDALEAVQHWRGFETLVVSMGEQGALFLRAGQAVQAIPPRVNVKSTVGAGDAMVAGLVAALSRGLDLEATARLATSFSAGSIQQVGANLPDPATLQQLQANVELLTLSLQVEGHI